MDNQLPEWHVDGPNIHQETVLGPNGSGLVQQWAVPYIIDSGPAKGSSHTVVIAPRDFTEASVQQAIRESLNSVHRVASLTHASA